MTAVIAGLDVHTKLRIFMLRFVTQKLYFMKANDKFYVVIYLNIHYIIDETLEEKWMIMTRGVEILFWLNFTRRYRT